MITETKYEASRAVARAIFNHVEKTAREAGCNAFESKNALHAVVHIGLYGSRVSVLRALFALGFGLDHGRGEVVSKVYDANGLLMGDFVSAAEDASATLSPWSLANSTVSA